MTNVILHVIIFISTVIISYHLSQFFRRITIKANINFNKKLRGTSPRWRTSNKPLVGGIVFIVMTLIGSLFFFLYSIEKDLNFSWYSTEVAVFFLGITIAFIGGLYDDVNFLPPLIKAGIQLLTGILFILGGVKINIFPSETLNIFLTLFWVVGIMNSINMLDNMDGVAGALSLSIVSSALFIEIVFFRNPWWLFMWLMLTGILIGYLYINKPPARIYMGDSGSQFLGAVISFIGIKYFWQVAPEQSWSNFLLIFWAVMPYIVLISDTTFVVVRRILNKQSPIVGGRDHISHMLTLQGISERKIYILLASINYIGAIIYFAILTIPDSYRSFIAVFVFAVMFLGLAYSYIQNYKRSEYYKSYKSAPVKNK